MFIADMKRKIKYVTTAVLDLILPRTCITCGQRLIPDERYLCLECIMDMPLTHFWERSHNPMADKFNGIIQKALDADIPGREPYAYAAALFSYRSEGSYRQIPYQIKYHGNTAAGRYFGHMLGRKLSSSDFLKDVDVLIPVPLHWTRKWKRGYNQAEMIAEGAASAMNVPVRSDLLVRRRRTKTQTKLDIDGKARNVENAFAVRSHALSPCQETFPFRHILLIDDVFTTGSTLMACFTALRTVFPPGVRISVATLGFVGEG